MPLAAPAASSRSLDQFSSLAQRQGVASRNLVNADELKTWLEDLLASRFNSSDDANEASLPPRQAACQRWLLSVARKWMTRQGQIESHQPSGEALTQSPVWIQQAISNGTPPQRLSLAPSEREILAGVLDWMRSDDGPALASDWSRISVDQAILSEKSWIDALAKAALKKDLEAADAAGTTLFADSPAPGTDGRAGWRWVQVQSSEALDREGSLMRHCVGSYADDVAAERKSIYSLRDPDNKPRLTLETQQGRIAQLKAFANQTCPSELFSRVADFANAFNSHCQAKDWPVYVNHEAEATGVFIFPGLGFCTPDTLLTEELSIRLAAEISEKNEASVATLPLLAALGWNDLLQLALPHASIELHSKALFKAAEFGQLYSLQLLLSHSDDNGNHDASELLSSSAVTQAMAPAARNGHIAIIERLLPLSDFKSNGYLASQAFKAAVRNGHTAIVQLLLKHSDPNADHSVSLGLAALYGHQPVVELLLPLSDLENDEHSAFRIAAQQGHLSLVKFLLAHFDPKTDDSSALAAAAINGHLPVVELLLPYSDPKARNSEALKMAALHGHLSVVELLLPYSDPKAGNSEALKMAAFNGHLPVVELLLPHSELKDQRAALQLADESEFSEISELIQAAINAQAHPKAPELASVGHKLLHERQRQSRTALAPASRP